MSRESLGLLQNELGRFLIGNKELTERLVVALLADGHVLLEGAPGLAKTRTVSVLASCLGGKMKRIQFTPDLLPSDILGTEIYRPQQGAFETRIGPIMSNIVLVDEINRAPAKVQSALLQAMQEREVTIGDTTYQLPRPFFVLATQNPIEQEGTYPLPEAQLDRFLFKLLVDYPDIQQEKAILKLSDSHDLFLAPHPECVLPLPELIELQGAVRSVPIDDRLDDYIVRIVQATRYPQDFGLTGMIEWGASPRASLALRTGARALALLRNDPAVLPEHIQHLAPDVLRHRIVASFEAESSATSNDEIVRALLKSIRVP
jgi:MoxR-like ATPase